MKSDDKYCTRLAVDSYSCYIPELFQAFYNPLPQCMDGLTCETTLKTAHYLFIYLSVHQIILATLSCLDSDYWRDIVYSFICRFTSLSKQLQCIDFIKQIVHRSVY